MLSKDQIEALRAPFPTEEVHWRAGASNSDGNRALALAYIDARAVMDRLDEVVGPMNWADTYDVWKDGAVKAGIGIRNNEWVWKYDGADDTHFEATKGGFSDAFKRAAVKWGIGRYLYQLPGVWVPCQKTGNSVKLLDTPSLPTWALPEGQTAPETTEPEVGDVSASEDTQEGSEGSQEAPEVATATSFWRLANEALKTGISHERVRHIAQTIANGSGGWAGAMAALQAEMQAA